MTIPGYLQNCSICTGLVLHDSKVCRRIFVRSELFREFKTCYFINFIEIMEENLFEIEKEESGKGSEINLRAENL